MGYFILFPLIAAATTLASQCKVTTSDASWPSEADWSTLNSSISGTLIRTVPVASSCWPGNPFGSKIDCATVESNWTSAHFHGLQPESVDFPVFTNNSCIPPGSTGYSEAQGCTLGGLPQYIVNATSAEQVALALKWAADRQIRIIVKGTGHDLCGRSSGANSLSIWTHNLRVIEFHDSWSPENYTEDPGWSAVTVGAGWTWGEIYEQASNNGKAVVGGGTGTVGIGGHTGAGGHGPLSSIKGLASDQILQATIATTEGKVYVANDKQCADIFWAVRGGGPGVYGIITEYVIRTYSTPTTVLGAIQIQAALNTTEAIEAAWNAITLISSSLPNWMDQGLSGTTFVATGSLVAEFVPGAPIPAIGPVAIASLNGFNNTAAAMNATVLPTLNQIQETYGANLSVTYIPPVEFPSLFAWFNTSQTAMPVAYYGIQSSRLLTKQTLQSPLSALSQKIKDLMTPQQEDFGSVLVLTMTAGKGVADVPPSRRGAVLPAWRSSYVHAIASTAFIDDKLPPAQAFEEAGAWLNENTELKWDTLQPNAGAYFHESNQFTPVWKTRFWGENYDRLKEIKLKYDPSESLFVAQAKIIFATCVSLSGQNKALCTFEQPSTNLFRTPTRDCSNTSSINHFDTMSAPNTNRDLLRRARERRGIERDYLMRHRVQRRGTSNRQGPDWAVLMNEVKANRDTFEAYETAKKEWEARLEKARERNPFAFTAIRYTKDEVHRILNTMLGHSPITSSPEQSTTASVLNNASSLSTAHMDTIASQHPLNNTPQSPTAGKADSEDQKPLFPKFMDLPLEIQRMIWIAMFPAPRRVRIYGILYKYEAPPDEVHPTLPITLHICHESRVITLEHYIFPYLQPLPTPPAPTIEVPVDIKAQSPNSESWPEFPLTTCFAPGRDTLQFNVRSLNSSVVWQWISHLNSLHPKMMAKVVGIEVLGLYRRYTFNTMDHTSTAKKSVGFVAVIQGGKESKTASVLELFSQMKRVKLMAGPRTYFVKREVLLGEREILDSGDWTPKWQKAPFSRDGSSAELISGHEDRKRDAVAEVEKWYSLTNLERAANGQVKINVPNVEIEEEEELSLLKDYSRLFVDLTWGSVKQEWNRRVQEARERNLFAFTVMPNIEEETSVSSQNGYDVIIWSFGKYNSSTSALYMSTGLSPILRDLSPKAAPFIPETNQSHIPFIAKASPSKSKDKTNLLDLPLELRQLIWVAMFPLPRRVRLYGVLMKFEIPYSSKRSLISSSSA
ncbi:hypothetical protein G7Y89_g10198 [Cudoniella acicularis]|uniref:FAD-binding PCMH-type domain-containing protein n=1 Tax=Cudoniella acicularis TaxID=354080 RepID=A0A8H4REA4_9HELO|nr:hypothetical protein G7Y89_g10198 [Cudoniella acicularis]